jgi:hypothetical protein
MTQSFIQRSFFAILFIVLSMASCKEDEAQPAPTISSYSPTSAFSGGIITITGENFGSKIGDVKVYFYDGAEAVVNSVTKTTISVTIPDNAYVGPVTVRIKEMETEGTEFTVLTMCHVGGEFFLPCNKILSEGPK